MKREDIVGIIVAVLMAALLAGLWLWARWRNKKREASWPTKWVNRGGPVPQGVEVALAIICQRAPGLPPMGYIDWVPEPMPYGEGYSAGFYLGRYPVTVQVVFDPLVERTALAHELGHAWYEITKGLTVEPKDDPAFALWVDDTNRRIKAALTVLR